MALGRNPAGIDFDSLDGKPVKIIIMIASSDRQRDEFLKVLAKVVLLFKEEPFRKKVLKAANADAVLALLKS
jgi:mannitol/fructose-specific phosphotransferase system IIA component (Ntr-type)